MVVDLVGVVNGADLLRGDVQLVVELLERADDGHVLVLRDASRLALLVRLAVQPLARLNVARTVTDLVHDARRRRRHVVHGADIVDLAPSVLHRHATYVGHINAIDLPVGIGVRLLRLTDLLDGHRAQSLVRASSLHVSSNGHLWLA